MYLSSFDTLGSLPSTFDRPSPLSSAPSTPRGASFGFAGSFRAPSPFQGDLPMFAGRSARTSHLEAPMDMSLPPLPPLPMPPKKRRPETLTSQNRSGGYGQPGLSSLSDLRTELPPLAPLPGMNRPGLPDLSFSQGAYPSPMGFPGNQPFGQRQRRGSSASLYGNGSQASAFTGADFGTSYTAAPSPLDSFGASAGYGCRPPPSASPFVSGSAFEPRNMAYGGSRGRKTSGAFGMTASPFDDPRYYSTPKRNYPVY